MVSFSSGGEVFSIDVRELFARALAVSTGDQRDVRCSLRESIEGRAWGLKAVVNNAALLCGSYQASHAQAHHAAPHCATLRVRISFAGCLSQSHYS